MTCCGRLWRNLGNHLRFAHGEEVVIPEREHVYSCTLNADHVGKCSPEYDEWYELWDGDTGNLIGDFGNLEAAARVVMELAAEGPIDPYFLTRYFEPKQPPSATVPCFCGAPAVGYDFDLMGDGQATNRQARCVEHLVGLP